MNTTTEGTENEFIRVKGRNRKGNKAAPSDRIIINEGNCITSTCIDNNHPPRVTIVRRVNAAVNHLKETDYFKSFYKVLLQSLQELRTPETSTNNGSPLLPTKIVCFGLGTFSDCMIARYQLGFLILLQKELDISVEIFDPVFTSSEKRILAEDFGFKVLSENEEGKRTVEDLTLFYLPHCSHQLVNNLLYANWSSKALNNCVIVSNSFLSISDSLAPRILAESLPFIAKIQAVNVEYGVVNCFQFTDIFNDAAIHVFPNAKLNLFAEDFWLDKESPVYSNVDFVPLKKSLENEFA